MRCSELLALARGLGIVERVYWDFDGRGFYAKGPDSGVSVIWHFGSYSGGRFGEADPDDCEIFLDGADDVEGYVDCAKVADLLRMMSAQGLALDDGNTVDAEFRVLA